MPNTHTRALISFIKFSVLGWGSHSSEILIEGEGGSEAERGANVLRIATWSSKRTVFFCFWSFGGAPILAKYEITFFVFSVLPAPDSPVINIDWFSLSEWDVFEE